MAAQPTSPPDVDRTTTNTRRTRSNASQEEDRRAGQGAAPGRRRDAGPAGRYRPRSARRQHHGVLQGLQRRRPSRMRGNVIPVEITIYEDRSFTFITKTPPAAELIKKAAGLQKGSGVPHKEKVGKLTKDQVREIADDQDARPQRQRHRRRDEDRRGHRPLHGRHRRLTRARELSTHQPAHVAGPRWPADHTLHEEREPAMQRSKTYRAAAETDRQGRALRPARAAIKIAKASQQEEVRRDRRRRDAPRRRPPQGRPDGPRHRQPARTAPARPPASWSSRTPRRPTPPVRPAPTSSVATS